MLGGAAMSRHQERKQQKKAEEMSMRMHEQMMASQNALNAQMTEYHKNAERMYNEQQATMQKAQGELEAKKNLEQQKHNKGIARMNRSRRQGGIFNDEEDIVLSGRARM